MKCGICSVVSFVIKIIILLVRLMHISGNEACKIEKHISLKLLSGHHLILVLRIDNKT